MNFVAKKEAGTMSAFPAEAAWHDRNPLKRWAHIVLASRVRRGLVNPETRQRCGAEKAEAHHPDYHRPLLVERLCGACHKREHARQRRAAR